MAENEDRLRSGDMPTEPQADAETLRSDGTEEPLAIRVKAAFQPDEIVAGRYRIIALIAKGGMGEVYEAEDLELHGRVALKTIRADIIADEKSIARFRREIHLARQVTHPNVCRVFDVSHHRTETNDVMFVTMELLHGQPLSDAIRQRRFTTAEALPVIEQMAEALHAAHAAGVIHRDFKPANVMITNGERPRVVVTDFGIARTVGDADAVTSTGDVVGTAAYMAPEQVEGGPVSPATDIYALGIVIYQMLTGRLPFTATTPAAAALARLRQVPEPPRKHIPDLDRTWQETILRCLERDPANRFLDARHLIDALTGRARVPPARKKRRLVPAVLAAVMLTIVVAGGVFMWRRQPQAPAAQTAKTTRPSVAILGFRNLSGRPDAAWLSTAMAEMLTSELASGERLRLASVATVSRVKRDLALVDAGGYEQPALERVRNVLHNDYAIAGSFVSLGPAEKSQLRVDVTLQDMRSGNTIASIAETGTEGNLFELIGRVGLRLREKLGIGNAGRDAAAIMASLPSDVSAARLYAEGLDRLRMYDTLGARDLLERAVAAEPKFASAHVALMSAYHLLGYEAKARREGELALANAGSLPREARLDLEGQVHSLRREYDRAAEIDRSLWQFFPDNLEYALALAFNETYRGNSKDALALVESLKKQWDDPRIDVAEAEISEWASEYKRGRDAGVRAVKKADAVGARQLSARARVFEGWSRLSLSDFAGATAAFDDAMKRFTAVGDQTGIAQGLGGLGAVLMAEQKYGEARKRFEESGIIATKLGWRTGESTAIQNKATLAWKQGNLSEARAQFEKSVVILREVGEKPALAQGLNNLGLVHLESGDLGGGARLFEEALAINREIGAKRSAANNLSNLAIVAKNRGDLDTAERLSREAASLFKEMADPVAAADMLNNIAVLQRTRGDLAAAEKSFEEAATIYTKLNSRSDLAMVAANVASILVARGDLEAARRKFESALTTWRSTGERSYAAYALIGLGDIDLKQANFGEAAKYLQQSLDERLALGEKGTAAESQLALAQLALEQNRLAEAEKLARAAVVEFEAEQAGDNIAAGQSLLARIALERRDLGAARKALAIAQKLADTSSDIGVKAAVAVTEARVAIAAGQPRVALQQMTTFGQRFKAGAAVQDVFESRLTLAAAKMASGRTADAAADLDLLKWDASKIGFNAIAKKTDQTRRR